MEGKYRSSTDKERVLRLADWLLAVLDPCSLNFSRMVRESPSKAVGSPYGALSKEQVQLLGNWVAHRDLGQCAAALRDILAAACDTLADPKAPFRLGLAMVLALLARHRPGAVAALATDLVAHPRRLVGHGRLPLTAWLLLEAAEAEPWAPLHAALQGLLPALAPQAAVGLEFSPSPLAHDLHVSSVKAPSSRLCRGLC